MPNSPVQARFLNLMTLSGVIKPFLRNSTDGQGAPVFAGTNTTVQMHFHYEREIIWGKEGQLNVPHPVAYLATTALVDPRSRFIFSGTTYRIKNVIQVYDDSGVHHTRLDLFGG